MIRASLIFLLLGFSSHTWALSSDSEQPIAVEADSLEVREAENISIYQGNVSLIQGSLQIRSDRLVIHFTDSRQLRLMEMTGSPARFRQLDDEQNELLGQARQIDYTESESLLEMRGAARFSQAGDTIEGELIRVNTETNAIEAGSSESDGRVKMLIQPSQE